MTFNPNQLNETDRISAARMLRSVQKTFGHKVARQLRGFYVRKAKANATPQQQLKAMRDSVVTTETN